MMRPNLTAIAAIAMAFPAFMPAIAQEAPVMAAWVRETADAASVRTVGEGSSTLRVTRLRGDAEALSFELDWTADSGAVETLFSPLVGKEVGAGVDLIIDGRIHSATRARYTSVAPGALTLSMRFTPGSEDDGMLQPTEPDCRVLTALRRAKSIRVHFPDADGRIFQSPELSGEGSSIALAPLACASAPVTVAAAAPGKPSPPEPVVVVDAPIPKPARPILSPETMPPPTAPILIDRVPRDAMAALHAHYWSDPGRCRGISLASFELQLRPVLATDYNLDGRTDYIFSSPCEPTRDSLGRDAPGGKLLISDAMGYRLSESFAAMVGRMVGRPALLVEAPCAEAICYLTRLWSEQFAAWEPPTLYPAQERRAEVDLALTLGADLPQAAAFKP